MDTDLYVAIVRRSEPISGAATQPEYHVGPLTEAGIDLFERHFEETYGDEVVQLYSPNQLLELI